MELAAELRELLIRYVQGNVLLSDMRGWLARHARAVAQVDDPALDDLEGLAWLLIAELDRGHRTEDGVRRELHAALHPIGPNGVDGSATVHRHS
jgi:hypothetical protein